MKVNVIKIGGNVVDNPAKLKSFVEAFAAIKGNKVLVHGGGKEATRLCQQLGIATTMIEGRRVTDRPTLDVVTMVYAGLVNKRIVALLEANNCDAIGLTGADGDMICAVRRPAEPIDYGYVGDLTPEGVNSLMLMGLLKDGFTTVHCAITHDGAGTLLNCNADTVAAVIAKALAASGCVVDLVYCFEHQGVMASIDDPDSLIRHINPATFAQLREEGVVSGGMVPKITNALDAVGAGVARVVIKSSDEVADPDAGTVVTL